MRRRVRCGAAVALLALGLAQAPTGAQEQTGISGQVRSTMELSTEQAAPGRVEATISATVSGTQLSVSAPGRPAQVLGTYRGPMTQRKVTAAAGVTRSGVTEQTITFGPQSP
jgi:hypothetical protein